MTSPLQPPARLSYIGVPRSLAWGYSYGSLCFVAAGTAAVTFSEDWMLVMCFVACLAACYARFVGTRVHVAVWSRGADDGYEVMTRVFGVTSRYIASRVPELDFSELNNAAWVQTESLRSSQLALKLKLGSSTLLLPSLHAGAGLADARARLEPFRAALLALAELSGKPQTYEHVRQEGRLWTFPKFPERGNPHIEELRWANGEPDKVMLRHGMTRLLLPEGRAEASFLGLAALLVAASAVLPSDQSLTHRAGFAAGALSLALIAFAFATLELAFDWSDTMQLAPQLSSANTAFWACVAGPAGCPSVTACACCTCRNTTPRAKVPAPPSQPTWSLATTRYTT